MILSQCPKGRSSGISKGKEKESGDDGEKIVSREQR